VQGSTTIAITRNLLLQQLLSSTTATAIPGQPLEVHGRLDPLSPVTFTFDDTPVSPASPVSTDGDGTYDGTVTLPATATYGYHWLHAKDVDGQVAGLQRILVPTAGPFIVVSPISGKPGDQVDIIVSGADPESFLSFQLAGSTCASNVVVFGPKVQHCTVPQVAPGSYTASVAYTVGHGPTGPVPFTVLAAS
jgi:hypothetical protein